MASLCSSGFSLCMNLFPISISQNEAMTSQLTFNPVFSPFTFAALEDSGLVEVVIRADHILMHYILYAGGIVSTIPLLMSWCGGVMQDAALRREVAENGLTSKFQSKFQIK